MVVLSIVVAAAVVVLDNGIVEFASELDIDVVDVDADGITPATIRSLLLLKVIASSVVVAVAVVGEGPRVAEFESDSEFNC